MLMNDTDSNDSEEYFPASFKRKKESSQIKQTKRIQHKSKNLRLGRIGLARTSTDAVVGENVLVGSVITASNAVESVVQESNTLQSDIQTNSSELHSVITASNAAESVVQESNTLQSDIQTNSSELHSVITASNAVESDNNTLANLVNSNRKRNKKGHADPRRWKKNINQLKRMHGKNKQMKNATCKCCLVKFTQEERENIYRQIWNVSWERKRDFV